MRRTTKQISERYRGNLGYLRKPHYMRQLRTWAFVLAVIGSISIALGFYYLGGKPQFFNTGPLSANHAHLANNCQACHTNAQPDLVKVMRLDRGVELVEDSDLESLKALPSKAGGLTGVVQTTAINAADSLSHTLSLESARDALNKLSEQYAATAQLTRMDKACLQCHRSFALHQPQSAALNLRPVAKEVAAVHATGCAICHREHAGPQPMKMPAGESCESCHNQPQRLAQTLRLIKTSGPKASRRAQIQDLGDGVRRFIPPREVPHQPIAFKSFESGHPAFGYEKPGLQDPAAIKYGHMRHMQPDIPALKGGRRLDECQVCHQPGADGEFVQRIDYRKHCAECHSLQFDPDAPEIEIPHRDPEKVREFLRTLTLQYQEYAVKTRRITDLAQIKQYIIGQFESLRARGMTSAEEIERRVFYTGDPPGAPARVTTRSNTGAVFTSCSKCHEITPPSLVGAPVITPVNTAERWLTRGPFTHAEHSHVACGDCHAAKTSKQTSDILMPSRESCAQCHRPYGVKEQAVKARASDLATRQRTEGGIAADCQSCHKFHAPEEAISIMAKAQP